MRGLGLSSLLGLVVVGMGISCAASAQAGEGKKTKLSPEALFKKLDANSDGKLSREEFAKIGEFRKKKNDPKIVVKPVAAVAAKPDATDAKPDAAAVNPAPAEGKSEVKPVVNTKKLDKQFSRLDADKDGFLSIDEFKKIDELKAKKKKEAN